MPFTPFSVPKGKLDKAIEILEKEKIPHSGGTLTTDRVIYVQDDCTKRFKRACQVEGIFPKEEHPCYDKLTQI
jgi:hypothetical protein